MDWSGAWQRCCDVGLTLASLDSAGKLSCFSKLAFRFLPDTVGDFWLSGTDLGCPSNFRWCSLNRAFVDPELRWKAGHPKAGLGCVYLEVRNRSVLLATADCAEKKSFLCDVRKKASSQKAMQTECADIWAITPAEIDLLLNTSAFLTANVSLNLKCFLKCVGIEVGLFNLGALDSLAMLREIEFASQEDPVKMEQGFDAFDECSGKNFDDECVTAYETYKCGLEKTPNLVSDIVSNNFGNATVFTPPVPCLPIRRSCWLSNMFPCEINQTAIDAMSANNGLDGNGQMVTYQNKKFYVRNIDSGSRVNPILAYKHCCGLGMRLFEPQTLEDLQWAFITFNNNSALKLMFGDILTVNNSLTDEVWCGSRTKPFFSLNSMCISSVVHFSGKANSVMLLSKTVNFDFYDGFIKTQNDPTAVTSINAFICEQP
ncbi:uncharacterized protein LOC135937361 [Cloeon dipterum]|uniref:uncharacterized protein LOC135937361 n=1 Tax=Cloeon dipterum TaxID=197152 RepID=UPI00322045FF